MVCAEVEYSDVRSFMYMVMLSKIYSNQFNPFDYSFCERCLPVLRSESDGNAGCSGTSGKTYLFKLSLFLVGCITRVYFILFHRVSKLSTSSYIHSGSSLWTECDLCKRNEGRKCCASASDARMPVLSESAWIFSFSHTKHHFNWNTDVYSE